MKIDKPTLKKLTTAALKARDNAYAPYSNHPVGAAVLSGSGKIYAGANVENAVYGSTNCAERSAIAAMASAGERTISAVAVVGPGKDYLIVPCGHCRQHIREFGDGDTPVYCLWKDGRLGHVHTLAELLPYSFGPENMAEVGHGPKAKKKKK
jgi:cytidine deaminase